MSDKELIQLAAKACGFKWLKKVERVRDELGLIALWLVPADGSLGSTAWNPLTDDGAALRLAAALKIDLDWQSTKDLPEPTVEAYRSSNDGYPYFCATEPEAGYRRAITRVAAHIGKAMQETTS